MEMNKTSKKNLYNTMSAYITQEKRAEWICFALFVLAYLLVSCFHEAMYDEAQAWLIARDASWHELFFEIPHYEGHPPFWHLILAVFAKSGIPFDIGLRIPGAIFSIVTVWLILFRSPFPRKIKCFLPFTYYIFFRYSIIVRPYCVTMLAFCLAALCYRNKSKNPFLFAGALLLLCMSSAYGMAFAAGICVVWLAELFVYVKENYLKQILSMAILLFFNMGQLLLMIPKEDTNSVIGVSFSDIFYGMIYMCIIGPADAMFLDSGMDARLQNYAKGIVSGGFLSYINIILGLLTLAVIIYYVKKYKKIMLFTVPYIFFALFSSAVYFWYHHIGLIFLFLLFIFWCALDSEKSKENISEKTLEKIMSDKPKMKRLISLIAFLLGIGVSVAWNVFCSGTDLLRNTWYTKDLAEGIRELDADEGNCVLQWEIIGVGPFEEVADYSDADKYKHVPSITLFFDCLVYFDYNIFYNHNIGEPNISYNRQIFADEETQTYIMEEIASEGYPEYIVGYPFVLDALPLEDEMPNYYPVYRFEVYKPDKFIIDYNDRYIYAREDVYVQKQDWPIREQLQIIK